MFLIISGEFTMELRDKTLHLRDGDFVIIPKGTELKPVADDEVHVMLFEPASTSNTGNMHNEYTRTNLNRI